MSLAEKLNHIDPPQISLPVDVSFDVIVLPEEVTADGNGLYRDSVTDLAKRLRLEGVSAEYLHSKANRQWIGERGAADIILNFVLGIASSAGWDAVKAVFYKVPPDAPVRGKFARCVQKSDGVTWEWYEVEGTASEVAQVVEKLRDTPDQPPQLPQ
jgi:hypothetical protein